MNVFWESQVLLLLYHLSRIEIVRVSSGSFPEQQWESYIIPCYSTSISQETKASKSAQELHRCHLLPSQSPLWTSISYCLGPARTWISTLTGATNKCAEGFNSFHWTGGAQFGLSSLKAVLNAEIKHTSKKRHLRVCNVEKLHPELPRIPMLYMAIPLALVK